MASFNPQDYGFDEPPPRPTTPPVRRGFLVVLFVLCLAALLVYGSIYVAERIGYAWEAGRARADSEALAKLDEAGIVNRASALFRMATTAVSPAVVNVQSFRTRRGGEGFPGLPLGGNRMTPGVQSSELGSGVDHRQGKRLRRDQQPRRQRRRSDHGPARPGRRRPRRRGRSRPQERPGSPPDQGRSQGPGRMGRFRKLDIGDWVLAIGSPLGFDHSVTAGIVSATERNVCGSRSTSRSFKPTRRSIPATRAGRWSIWPARSWASTPPSSPSRAATRESGWPYPRRWRAESSKA